VSGGSGCDVWDYQITHGDDTEAAVLKVFRPGSTDYSKLGPVETARKCALAQEE
jgi:hypothetical protein